MTEKRPQKHERQAAKRRTRDRRREQQELAERYEARSARPEPDHARYSP